MSVKVPHFRRYLLTGIITVIPLWITWLIFDFILAQLSKLGMPWVRAASKQAEQFIPELGTWMLNPWFQNGLAILLTLLLLYIIGWFTSRVIGGKLLHLFETVLAKIPFVQTIYGATKKLLSVLQQKPDNIQRVVLIAFPSPEMRTVGFVTRVFKDADTGRELAAVYVPTTPNPTSGYLEIVPLENLISTDWTMEQAMTFIISGGAVAPDSVSFDRKPSEQSSQANL